MRFILLLLLIFSLNVQAQPPCSNQIGGSAQAAQSVCVQTVFNQTSFPPCTGVTLPVVTQSGCADNIVTDNAVWYRIRIFQSGTLGFTISPGAGGDDYDWQLMNITGRNPQDVYTTNLAVSFNLSATTGPTGCSAAGTLDFVCAGPNPRFNKLVNVLVGEDYLLMVNNYSNSGTGYGLTFSGGTAVLSSPLPPTITSVSQVGCNPSLLTVTVSKDIKCAGLIPSAFSIAGATINSITSQCTSGANAVNRFTILLQNPLPAGPHNLVVATNALFDVCNIPMAAASIPFTIASQAAPIVNAVTFDGCAPTVLKIALNKPVLCNNINLNQFTITPGLPTITGVQTNCGGTTTFTDTIRLVLQNPLPQGTYNVNILNSPPLTDTCGVTMVANYISPAFTVPVTPAAPLVTATLSYCQFFAAPALTATGTNLLWYTTATGGTGSSTAPTPSTAAIGTIVYYVSQSTGACEGPRASIAVTVNPSPAAPTVTTPVTYCQNTATIALTATGTSLLWYTVASGGVGSAIAPTPSSATAGTTIYYVSQTVTGCESPRAAITVNITATPLAPIVASPLLICQGSISVPLTATGTNLLWYTTATGGIGSSTAPTPSTATIGITNYYVSQSTANGCEGLRSLLAVDITTTPTAPTVTPTLSYCQFFAAPALTAVGTNLLWYTTATGGTGSSTAITPSTATTGTIIYYVSQSLGTCESPRAAISVTVNPSPLAPNVATPIAYCQNAPTTTLSATGTALLWYTVATGGTGSATAPTPSSTTPGATIYYVSQTVTGCESPRATITVNVTATPLAPIVTTPLVICQGSISVPLTAIGTNLLWYTIATGGTSSSTAPTPSTASTGITNYYVSQSTGLCEGPRALLAVDITTTPTAPIVANPMITYCQNATATALSATGSNLLWYAAATGGTGSSTAPTPSTTTVGNTNYYVSQSAGICESPRTLITVTVNTTPIAPTINTPLDVCQGAPTQTLSAVGTNLLWYTTPTIGIGSTTAPIIITGTPSNTTYYVSQTAGTCEGPRAAIVVNINAIPIAPTVTAPTITYCQNEIATVLTAIGSNLLWYTSATVGTGSSTAPTPSTATTGSTIFYVSQSSNGCESPRATITVTVNTTPLAPIVTTPVNYCINATAALLQAIGSNLLWYTTSTGGTSSNIIPTPPTTSTGVFMYYVSQSAGICESPRATITVNIFDYPLAPVVTSPVLYCPGAAAVQLTAPGTNLLWYTTPIGGVGTSIAPTPSTAVNGITNYYVSASSVAGGCEGSRALIEVNVNNPFVVNIGSDSTICEGSRVKFFPTVSPTPTNYLWTTLGGIPVSTIDTANIKDATLSPVDTAEYVLTVTLGSCTRSDTVKVNVLWKPIVEAGINTPICLGDSTLLSGIISHTSGPISSFVWTPSDSLRDATAIQTFAYPTKSTWYKLTANTTVADYGCAFSSYDSVRVILQPLVKAFAGNDTIAVKNVPHQLNGSGGLVYTWSSPSAVINNPFIRNPKATLNNDAIFYLEVNDAIGCKGYDTVFVKVYNGPTYYVPNSFTPNGDGLNDIFRAIPVGLANTTYFRVFNRLGELMFETNQYLKGWDGTYKGKPQPTGTYVWMVAGTDRDFKKVEMKGTVNIIR